MGKTKYGYLDCIRFIAITLVLYGHFICVGTNNTSLPEIIALNNEKFLPLIPAGTHAMYNFEISFNSTFHAQSAVVGVFLFFLLTGYLTAMTRDRYTAKQFVINKLLRLYPVLIFATIVSGILLYYTQGIIYNIHNYIGTFTLLYPFLQIAPTLGVLWTLIVELLFYLIILYFKKLDWKFIVAFDAFVILAILFNKSLNSVNLFSLIYYLKYISIILIGTAIRYSEEIENKILKGSVILGSAGLSYLILYLNKIWAGDETTYTQIGTYLTALFIYLTFYYLNKYKANVFNKVPKVITFVSSISYPIYLLQIPIGLTIMYWVKLKITSNAYIIVTISFICLMLISYLVHKYVEELIHKSGKKIFKI